MDNTLRIKIEALFDEAYDGRHQACRGCSRNPQQEKHTAFARPCLEHYGLAKHGLLFILRDPGGKGASLSGKLCPDEKDNNDKTARIIRKWLKQIEVPSKSICFSNAVLHGYLGRNAPVKEQERRKCKIVLWETIDLLQPKAVIALGLEALQSVREILLDREMPRPKVKEMVNRRFVFERARGIQIFGLPHPAHEIPNLYPYKLRPDDAWGIVSRRVHSIDLSPFTGHHSELIFSLLRV
jgi:uracil-DNA glycosylase